MPKIQTPKIQKPDSATSTPPAIHSWSGHLAAHLRDRTNGLKTRLLAALDVPAGTPRVPPAAQAPGPEAAPWSAIIDALADAAVALNGAGIIVHHNAAAAEFFPRIRTGQPVSHVWRSPEFMTAIEKIAMASKPIPVALLERVPVERRFLATLSRVKPPAGMPADGRALPTTLITFRDFSEQDKLAQMRADFIANASHELRTPLASLRGFIETLQGPARDDPKARARFLALMAVQATRMTRLIDDLLSLSRAEMRVHLPPRGIVELNETCSFVVQSLEPVAQASQCTVTL